jgi:hypothetical protein
VTDLLPAAARTSPAGSAGSEPIHKGKSSVLRSVLDPVPSDSCNDTAMTLQ